MEAGVKPVEGAIQTSTRPWRPETDSAAKRLPVESKAMPTGCQMALKEVSDGRVEPSVFVTKPGWPRTISAAGREAAWEPSAVAL